MAKKKKEEVVTEPSETEEIIEYFEYNTTAYLPVFNDERKAYDMWLIRVDTNTKACHIEVEECRYNTSIRAAMDLKQRYAKDFVSETMRIKKEK